MKRVLLTTIVGFLPLICNAQDYSQSPTITQTPIQQVPVQQVPMQQTPLPAPNAPMGDPNYYGQVDLANNNPPPVIYSTPLVVQPAPPGVVYPPLYLRAPPIYYQNWPQYCGYFNACFYPVFFVQEAWYINLYAPWYRRYYPYGRPGWVAHVGYNPHWGGGYYHDHGYGEHGERTERGYYRRDDHH